MPLPPKEEADSRNILSNCLTKIFFLLRKSKNFAVIVKKFIFKVFPKSAKTEIYRKTVGIASSFGGSGGEADDRGQSESYCKTANIAFLFGSMKNILFPFFGGKFLRRNGGRCEKANIASSFGGKFLRRNGSCCEKASIASSFGGSGGEADDRGQNVR